MTVGKHRKELTDSVERITLRRAKEIKPEGTHMTSYPNQIKEGKQETINTPICCCCWVEDKEGGTSDEERRQRR